MERQHLIELVQRILSVTDTEEKLDQLIKDFEQNVPDPHALNYLYGKKYEDFTPEQIVDKALSYKPFYL